MTRQNKTQNRSHSKVLNIVLRRKVCLSANQSLVVRIAHLHVTLALVELVHVGVAEITAVLLDARHQLLFEAEAHVLVLSIICVGRLLLGCGVHLLLLHRLLLRGGLVMTAVATATAHHRANSLVANLATSSESHACDHSAHETTAAEAHALRLRLLRGRRCLTRRRPRWGSSPGRAAAGEEAAASTASESGART